MKRGRTAEAPVPEGLSHASHRDRMDEMLRLATRFPSPEAAAQSGRA
jgi:hypothetical protein